MAISFGDNVRVRSTPLTEEKGLSGLSGQVYGDTTPSVTGVDVIGDSRADYAINVYFKNQDASLWFASDLLEFVDHAPGMEIALKGVARKKVRGSDGQWIEILTVEPAKRPWWKFW